MPLTDRFILNTKPPAAGTALHRDEGTGSARHLGMRMSSRGERWFEFGSVRFPGGRNPTKAPLGDYPALSLEAARAKAIDWRAKIKAGIDPRKEAAAAVVERDRRGERLFETVAADFRRLVLVGPDENVPKQRTGKATAREIDTHFTSKLRGRSIETITREEIEPIITDIVESGRPAHAHNMLGHIRKLFNWALSRSRYRLDRSPCDRMRPSKLIGPKQHRERVLAAPELRALWSAAGELGYPYRDLFRLLALTGLRLNEVARLTEDEVDREAWTLNIPAARMKNKKPFVSPLSGPAREIVEALPRWSGPYLFSTMGGTRPVSGFSKAKLRLDAELARAGATVAPFTLHDLRRTMRTGLSALRVPEDIRELVLAHGKSGLRRTYDQHDFLDEKREALELWAGRLRSIVDPPDGIKVVAIRQEKAA